MIPACAGMPRNRESNSVGVLVPVGWVTRIPAAFVAPAAGGTGAGQVAIVASWPGASALSVRVLLGLLGAALKLEAPEVHGVEDGVK